MKIFRKSLLLILFGTNIFCSSAQDVSAVDSVKLTLAQAKTAKEKVKALDVLSRMLMNVNLEESEKYGMQLIEIAEESRDRELMVKAYLSNGTRCSYMGVKTGYTARAIGYFNKAEEIAKQSKLDKYVVSALIKLAAVNLTVPDQNKAADYAGQAASKVSNVDDDSLKILVLHTQGDVYMAKNSKIEALRFYLNALRLAEKIENPLSIRESYLKLSGFYAGIEDHDRAIDYYTLAYNKLSDLSERNIAYTKVIDVNSLGNLYAAKKSYDLAIKYYERSLQMADSLKFGNMQIPGYVSLLNVYLQMEQPKKALEFFDSEQGKKLRSFFLAFGMEGITDQAYAVIYSELGYLDSAGKYFDKSAPFFINSNNIFMKMNYFLQSASYYKKAGKYDKAIDLLLQVKTMGEDNNQLEILEKACKQLDSVYSATGDYKLASQFNSLHHSYKDSLQKINKEKELAQVEAQDEQDRQQKAVLEAAEKKRQRNNIQYLAITIGIVILFLTLILFGMFKVSAVTIKMVGFFSFLMFFEFIFLIFKKNIYSITHGEPWMDLAFMIGLAAVLLPLHHWLEHKVLHYLTSHNRLTTAGLFLKNRIFRNKKAAEA